MRVGSVMNKKNYPELDVDKLERARKDIKDAGTYITSNFYNVFKNITDPDLLKIYIYITIGFAILIGTILYPIAYLSYPLFDNKIIQEWILLSFEFFIKLGSYFWTAIISMLFQKFINGIHRT